MLHVHHAARADALADALAGLLAQPPQDAFAPEVVAVPTRGMERWLTQRMSATLGARPQRADGVCANVLFPSPHRLVADAVATAAGIEPASDPWQAERAVWPLLETVEAALPERWLAPLAAYLGAAADARDPVRAGRRLTAIAHIAALFERYALHRPGMVQAWARGENRDAAGEPLAAAGVWQPELWRRLRARLGVPDLAERRADACERMITDPALLDLPGRLSIFGLTRLPAGHLQILRALAHGRELHLFLLHPSAALWTSVAHAASAVSAPAVLRRVDDPTPRLAVHPLLASWGRDIRESQLVLMRGAGPAADRPHPAPEPAETLLGRIQRDIRANAAPPGPPLPGRTDMRAPVRPGDCSIEVHSCHGRARQVEVLRDAVLHALATDPELEPRDVIVMCPDIEAFAPLIQATFGAGEVSAEDPGADAEPSAVDLRVRLADRALRQTNPVLGVVAQLLGLAEQRLTASQLLDLADRPPVRRRFHLDDDDMTRLQDWIAQSGIRWGLDASHRERYKLGRVESGTWRSGLNRVLLGVTMTEDDQRLFGDVLPLDDVDSRSIGLAGRFAELVARAGAAARSLSETQPLGDWAQALAEAADGLTATSPRDRWQRAELQRILDDVVQEAASAAATPLSPAEIRSLLAARLEGRPTRANFRTGHLTVCTLLPMRSVPHRVVCLLGLDDGAFPRKAPRDGDDLMLGDPLVGERDPRSEDRQLLLDGLMAATERLIITYTGNDERTNAVRPPAVPVGELLDTIDATARAAREQVLVRHPLQPFDPRNFTPGAVAGTEPWSFDAGGLAGAQALIGAAGPRLPPPPFLRAPLAPRRGDVIELADLVRFLEHPVRAFLRQRLGISLRTGGDEVQDGLPVQLDGLERWAVGQRLLEARLRGVDERSACLGEIRRGTLPPGALGEPVIRSLFPMVRAIVAEAATAVPGGAGAALGGDPVDVRVDLGGGRLLSGTVSGVIGDVLLATTFSRVSAKHRMGAWARLVALSATFPGRPFRAATVGRAGGRDDVRTALIGPLDPTAARTHLDVLVDLYDRGMREPLPLFCHCSEAYAAAARAGQDPVVAAEREWESAWSFDREDRELEHQLVLGGVLAFTELLDERPTAEETGAGWPVEEDTRVGRYARRLWDGLLACESVSAR